jgi:hypothetical protein
VDHKLLSIYLNDHLLGSTVGRDLSRRAAANNRGNDYGRFLSTLAAEIAEDRETLLEFMDAVDADPSRLKVAGGWITEKLGRLKLNGELIGDSPLSRFVELESLSLGVEGKRLLWIALLDTRPERFGAERLRELIARAERQRVGIEEHRRKAAREALGG